ncbi:MAG: hypothetical protein JJE02_03495 [Propionibacteriales bacterium]|nr:hypothetical protein [Propionibacteriales bacterium]
MPRAGSAHGADILKAMNPRYRRLLIPGLLTVLLLVVLISALTKAYQGA